MWATIMVIVACDFTNFCGYISIIMNRIDGIGAVPVFGVSRLRMGTDGPGVTTLVGFMRCPLRCRYCINPQCHKPIFENDGTTVRPEIMMLSPQELYDKVKMDNIYFQASGGGVCFGGGEPTLYEGFISEFRRLCGDRWKITIETCLHCSADTIERLSSVVNYWIVDVKSLDRTIYKEYTGVDTIVLDNLRVLEKFVSKERVNIVVPHIPEYNDDVDLNANIQLIKDTFGFENVSIKEYINRLKL